MLTAGADGSEIVTVKRLSGGDSLKTLQEASARSRACRAGSDAGHADDRARIAAREPGPERAGDPRGHLRQPVPLRTGTGPITPPSGDSGVGSRVFASLSLSPSPRSIT